MDNFICEGLTIPVRRGFSKFLCTQVTWGPDVMQMLTQGACMGPVTLHF